MPHLNRFNRSLGSAVGVSAPTQATKSGFKYKNFKEAWLSDEAVRNEIKYLQS